MKKAADTSDGRAAWKASGTQVSSCLPLLSEVPDHMSKSKPTTGIVNRNVSSPVLTALMTPVRMKNTEGKEGRDWKCSM